ncbi:MAG: DegT/DnrJ/EryC1/StrS family aminotransferase [candidate division WOR-3 bacterium]
MDSIALSEPWIGVNELTAVRRALYSGRLALGPFAARFERMVAEYVGMPYAVGVSSGTAALHLIVRALGLTSGDEVITTPFSFIASANCLLYEHVRPVFCDIEPATLCIDPALVEERIGSRTRAILAVDVFGHPADWPALQNIAKRHGLYLIEDSCEALGAGVYSNPGSPQLRRCGSFAGAAAFAFYPNKQLTTGEGGMIVTDSRRIAELCRSMANQGRRACAGTWLEHVRLGYNYRLDELSAALGCAQMQRLEKILIRRRAVARMYARCLKTIPGIIPPIEKAGTVASWFVYCIRLNENFTRADRNRILGYLRSCGIECSDYFRPIHLQPFYRREFGFCRGYFPVAEAAGDRTIALPFHARLSRRAVEKVCATLAEAVRRTGRE